MVWDLICLGKIWSYTTQRAMSCCLYKYRSWPIVIQCQHNQSNLYFYTFCPSFLVFSFSLWLDLVFVASIPWLVMVQAPSPTRHHLTKGEAPSSKPGGAPNCRRSWQNRIVQFTKPNSLVSTVLSRRFWFLFISCGNTFNQEWLSVVAKMVEHYCSVKKGWALYQEWLSTIAMRNDWIL
jgi:hypothetical protein